LKAGLAEPGCLYVDHTGKYRSSKVIAQKLASIVNLDELLIGDGEAQSYEVDLGSIRSQNTSTSGTLLLKLCSRYIESYKAIP